MTKVFLCFLTTGLLVFFSGAAPVSAQQDEVSVEEIKVYDDKTEKEYEAIQDLAPETVQEDAIENIIEDEEGNEALNEVQKVE